MARLFRRLPDSSPRGVQYLATIETALTTDSCVVFGAAREAQFPVAQRPLTLATAAFGRVRYELDSRSIAVDDDGFLILNAGQVHGCTIQAAEPVENLQFYFHADMLYDVLHASTLPFETLLDRAPETRSSGFEFFQELTRRERVVSPVLRYIRHCILSQAVSDEWLEEQVHYLLHRMLLQQRHTIQRELRIDCARPATRAELRRRAARVADYIDSNFEQDFGLRELARIACLSRFHLLRLFRRIYGVTPQAYKLQKRMRVARRLLESRKMSRAEVAAQVGYGTRTSLWILMQRLEASGAGFAASPIPQAHIQKLATS